MYLPDTIPDADRERLAERAGYGGEIELRGTVAVLVVDMTREFVEDQYPAGYSETGVPAAEATADLMETARENGFKGFYSRAVTGSHPAEKGIWNETVPSRDEDVKDLNSRRTEICEELSPTEEDVVFGKYKPSVFFGTQLQSMLNYEGVDSLVVTGITTSGCVRASVLDAFSYNYPIKIPEECVADRSQISHEINLFDMDMKYADVAPLADIEAEIEAL